MHIKKILITGGAGFVGSNIAVCLKSEIPDIEITVLDNLYRKGSELNIPRLLSKGINFVKGDVRNSHDIESAGSFDFLIECSAEPSVLAGKDGSSEYLVQTNLYGAVNCIEACRKNHAGMLFLSTSRVYPIAPLLNCEIRKNDKRFDFAPNQKISGISEDGVSEEFPMNGARSLYGATKFAAEIMISEYANAFSIPVVIFRCGVIAGPWQFGKVDQGIAVHWLAAHMFRKPLKYIGFEGEGKQVRDFLHVNDLCRLVKIQLENPEKFALAGVFNVGGGKVNSASLRELTQICERITGNNIEIGSEPITRYADIPVYITDNSKIRNFCAWEPEKNLVNIFQDIFDWINTTPAAKIALNS